MQASLEMVCIPICVLLYHMSTTAPYSYTVIDCFELLLLTNELRHFEPYFLVVVCVHVCVFVCVCVCVFACVLM